MSLLTQFHFLSHRAAMAIQGVVMQAAYSNDAKDTLMDRAKEIREANERRKLFNKRVKKAAENARRRLIDRGLLANEEDAAKEVEKVVKQLEEAD